jgi:hypothetical protein
LWLSDAGTGAFSYACAAYETSTAREIMKKTKLNLSELTVESFSTIPRKPEQRGTVVAHTGECSYPTLYNACLETVTYGENTCYCEVPRSDPRYCNTERDCSGDGMC